MEKLNQHFILGEIRDYIREFHELFPHVDLDVLLDLITDVRRKKVNPETQMRQFLLAFKNTETFQKALDELDDETRKKVLSFRGGASCGDLVKDGFHLPSSPAAKHHFRFLDKVHSLFHFKKDDGHEEVHQKPSTKIQAIIDHEGAKTPVVYEDADHKNIMKVGVLTDPANNES